MARPVLRGVRGKMGLGAAGPALPVLPGCRGRRHVADVGGGWERLHPRRLAAASARHARAGRSRHRRGGDLVAAATWLRRARLPGGTFPLLLALGAALITILVAVGAGTSGAAGEPPRLLLHLGRDVRHVLRAGHSRSAAEIIGAAMAYALLATELGPFRHAPFTAMEPTGPRRGYRYRRRRRRCPVPRAGTQRGRPGDPRHQPAGP